MPGPASQHEYNEIDRGVLPLFSQSRAIHLASNPGALKSLTPHEKFVRYVRIASGLRQPLTMLLEMADTVFESAADAVGAQVVPHTWGLASHFRHRASLSHTHSSLPTGKLLAAEVEFLPDLEPLDKQDRREIRDRIVHMPVDTTGGRFRWFDGGGNNFARNADGLHLIDLDIFLEPTN